MTLIVINLLPWRKIRENQENNKNKKLQLITIVVTLMILLVTHFYLKIDVNRLTLINNDLEQKLTSANAKIQKLNNIKKETELLQSKIKWINQIQKNQSETQVLIGVIQNKIPENLFITKISLDAEKIKLEGFSDRKSSITQFMQLIKSTLDFQEMKLYQPVIRVDNYQYPFAMIFFKEKNNESN